MKLLKNALLAAVLAFCSPIIFAQMLDINTATADQLKMLKGIGPEKAAAIVKYRETYGPFQSVENLTKVPGIKEKTLEKMKPMITIGSKPETPAVPAATATSTTVKTGVPTTPLAPPTSSAPPVPVSKP